MKNVQLTIWCGSLELDKHNLKYCEHSLDDHKNVERCVANTTPWGVYLQGVIFTKHLTKTYDGQFETGS